MKTSESIQSLAAALVAFNSECPEVVFDKENKFLGNKYATLGAILKAISQRTAGNKSASHQAHIRVFVRGVCCISNIFKGHQRFHSLFITQKYVSSMTKDKNLAALAPILCAR